MSVFDKVKSMFKKDDKPPASPSAASSGGPKIWSMPPEMQREFEKGVKYNMKLVIRGLRKTGKSSLLARLHGRPFPTTYTPSPEISAATIRYQPKDLPEDHGAKLDMWDVVDVGLKASSSSSSSQLQVVADATTIDVYRGCNCVIFLVDVMSRESLDYVVRESRAVPPTTAILIALNFVDLPKPHVVSERDVDEVCRRIQRVSTPLIFLASQGNPPEKSVSAAATWVPISAATGYGLDLVRAYMEIPFAMLHIEMLEAQMKGMYRKVEEHQAWLLSERAVLNFEEREKAKPKQQVAESPRKEDVQPTFVAPEPTQQPDRNSARTSKPEATAGNHAQPAPQKQASDKSSKPTKPSPPPSSRDYDESKIANDFFGDMSDDTPPAEDSSSEGELEPVPARRPGQGARGGTSPKQNSPPAPDPPSPSTAAVKAVTQRPQQPLPPAVAAGKGTAAKEAEAPKQPAPAARTQAPEPKFDFAVDDQKGVADDFFGADDDDEEETAAKPSVQPTPAAAPRATSPPQPAPKPAPTKPIPAPEVEDSFFGNDDDEDVDEGKNKLQKAAPARTASSDENDEDSQPARGGRTRAALRGRPQPKPAPKPVVTASVPIAIDIAALVSQMESAIVAQEAPDDDEAGRDRKEKKPKKDKHEKKAKKDKAKKHREAQDSDDGGFDEVRE